VSFRHLLKAAFKRGALVAAANWPVTLIQAIADAVFKLLIAAPLVGGIVLVTLVVRTDPDPFNASDWRLVAAGIVTSLLAHRLVLVAFLLSLAVVVVGGSLFVVLIKGGTLGVLVRGERNAAAIEVPPLQAGIVATAAAFSVEGFIACAQALFPKYARLALWLMAVYLASGAAYVSAIVAVRDAAEGWGATTLLTVVFVIWVTLVNLLYLLVQIVVATEEGGIAVALRRVVTFLKREPTMIAGVFFVTLALVVLATGASLLAFAALGLISLVPFVWLAAVPLQLMAFVLRAIVFQYIALSSVGAYLALYRKAFPHGRVDALEEAVTPVHAAGADARTYTSARMTRLCGHV
jgi:hypothetical protein